jgi:uroporphyrinogen decarboxylase
MAEMSHRERVLKALKHQEPDRIPLDLWGSANSVNDGIYFRIKDYLGIQGDIKPWRAGRTSSYYDERILDAFDIDFRHVWLKGPSSYKTVVYPDGSFDDEWGVTWKEIAGHIGMVRHPLAQVDPEDLSAVYNYPWPDPYDPGRTTNVRERARFLREETDFMVVSRAIPNFGTFDRACALRGTEQFLVDLMVNKKFAHALVDRIAQFEYELNDVLIGTLGDYIDIVCWAEDYGHQTNLFVPPNTYREFFKEKHRALIRMIKHKAPHVYFQFHTCGSVRKLIPDLIEIGVDILQSIQPTSVGMDSFELKRDFGKDLVFHGAIDIQYALPGTIKMLDTEVRKRIAALAPSGGYILSTANNVQDDTPAENLAYLFKAAKEYGHYPIDPQLYKPESEEQYIPS